jgi:exosortase/archaeosortase family protein
MKKLSFNSLKNLSFSELITKAIPQEIFKKIKLLVIIIAIFGVVEVLFRLFDISLLYFVSTLLSFIVLKFTALFMFFAGSSIKVEGVNNLILVNDEITFYFSTGMFGLRYYLAAIVLFYLYERKLRNRLWLTAISFFLFFLTSALLMNFRLQGNTYLIFNYSFVNETIITILLITYLIWKAIIIYKNKTKDEVFQFLYKSTITIWIIIFAVWWIFYLKYNYDDNFKASIYFYVAHYINHVASFIINLFGYESYVLDRRIIANTHFILVGRGCVGLQVLHVFAIVIILMGGRVLPKLIYIVAGLILINFLNVIRVIVLFIYMGKHLRIYDGTINAHTFYNNVVYVFVVLLWLFYMLYYHPKVIKFIEKRKQLGLSK